jgi:hypothetical protein
MAGRGDGVDSVATCYRLDSWILTPFGGGGDFLFLLLVLTGPGAHRAVFTVGNSTLSWEYSSQGMELFTHPKLVLILIISIALSLLLLCATVGMLWDDLYLVHVCG